MDVKRLIYILLGPVLLVLSILTLSGIFGAAGAQAIGVSLWMIFWWITRPVHITVTAIIPAIANAFLNMIPMTDVLANYASESIVLVFASGLIICPWAAIGLDRRIALKVLSIVGPSIEIPDDRMAGCYRSLLLRASEYRGRYAVLPDCCCDVKGCGLWRYHE